MLLHHTKQTHGLKSLIGRGDELLQKAQSAGALHQLNAHGHHRSKVAVPFSKSSAQTGVTDGYCRNMLWPPSSCFRELLQNTIDGIAEVATKALRMQQVGVIYPQRSADGNQIFIRVRSQDGSIDEPLAVVERREGPQGTVDILIHQSATVLSHWACELFSTKPQGSLGGFGEGFKMAALMLARQGAQMVYVQHQEAWVFKLSDPKNDRVPLRKLQVEVTKLDASAPEHIRYSGTTLTMAVRAPKFVADDMWQPDRTLPLTLGKELQWAPGKAMVLQKGEVPPGRIYIKGLYVQDCPQLAAMGISVELGEAGRLSRDRDHAIGWKEALSELPDLGWCLPLAAKPAALLAFEKLKALRDHVVAHARANKMVILSDAHPLQPDLLSAIQQLGIPTFAVVFDHDAHKEAVRLLRERFEACPEALQEVLSDKHAWVAAALAQLPGGVTISWRVTGTPRPVLLATGATLYVSADMVEKRPSAAECAGLLLQAGMAGGVWRWTTEEAADIMQGWREPEQQPPHTEAQQQQQEGLLEQQQQQQQQQQPQEQEVEMAGAGEEEAGQQRQPPAPAKRKRSSSEEDVSWQPGVADHAGYSSDGGSYGGAAGGGGCSNSSESDDDLPLTQRKRGRAAGSRGSPSMGTTSGKEDGDSSSDDDVPLSSRRKPQQPQPQQPRNVEAPAALDLGAGPTAAAVAPAAQPPADVAAPQACAQREQQQPWEELLDELVAEEHQAAGGAAAAVAEPVAQAAAAAAPVAPAAAATPAAPAAPAAAVTAHQCPACGERFSINITLAIVDTPMVSV